MSSSPDPYLWIVRFRREGWEKEQVRMFRRRYAARRLVTKLRGDDFWQWGHLTPLEYVRLERQTLGPIEVVEVWR